MEKETVTFLQYSWQSVKQSVCYPEQERAFQNQLLAKVKVSMGAAHSPLQLQLVQMLLNFSEG